VKVAGQFSAVSFIASYHGQSCAKMR